MAPEVPRGTAKWGALQTEIQFLKLIKTSAVHTLDSEREREIWSSVYRPSDLFVFADWMARGALELHDGGSQWMWVVKRDANNAILHCNPSAGVDSTLVN